MSSSTSSRSLASAPHAALTPQCSRAAAPPPTPPPPTTTSCQHRCLSRILGSEAEAGAGAVNAAAASAFLDALDATFRSETIAACVRTAATSTLQPPAPPGSASRSVAVAGSEAGAVPAAPCRSTPPMPPPPSAAPPTSPPPAPPSGPLPPEPSTQPPAPPGPASVAVAVSEAGAGTIFAPMEKRVGMGVGNLGLLALSRSNAAVRAATAIVAVVCSTATPDPASADNAVVPAAVPVSDLGS